MVNVDREVQADLIAAVQRTLKLGADELRVTDNSLIRKNPNYSLCDVMLRTDTVYHIEYLLSCWEARSGHVPCFIFKNTGSAVSLSCYLRVPAKLGCVDRVKEFNVLKLNQALLVCLRDIEQIKPSDQGVLTSCVIRRATCGSAYNLEFITFGPEDEGDYDKLLREIYLRKLPGTVADTVGECNRNGGAGSLHDDGGGTGPPAFPSPPPPPPPPPFGFCDCGKVERNVRSRARTRSRSVGRRGAVCSRGRSPPPKNAKSRRSSSEDSECDVSDGIDERERRRMCRVVDHGCVGRFIIRHPVLGGAGVLVGLVVTGYIVALACGRFVAAW